VVDLLLACVANAEVVGSVHAPQRRRFEF
jgi:hypothetical protein